MYFTTVRRKYHHYHSESQKQTCYKWLLSSLQILLKQPRRSSCFIFLLKFLNNQSIPNVLMACTPARRKNTVLTLGTRVRVGQRKMGSGGKEANSNWGRATKCYLWEQEIFMQLLEGACFAPRKWAFQMGERRST